ncbi:PE-PPE domain-containing protein [Mycolicibacterium sp. YH-1]|uniref:PE-PPE domain-containing protein n=1 Tax=Mycolicibacterium sp. YH-1 TaxID=2908837 RepID=UPI001F4C28AB|nr:PE-PPE domain-containing protein [Mycolicibacterium sp. YH-1]UNB53176.1 PE-PPE domain-containing protein [Mycolicibacterium sp. YH-1]
MARNHNGRHRRARDTALVFVTAAGMSGALVLGHATNNTVMDAMVALTNTVIGAGGRGDSAGERVQQKLSATVQPAGYGYEAVHYPATINLAESRNIGVPAMHLALVAHSSETYLIVAGYSEGSLVAERVRRNLQAKPVGPGPEGAPSADQLTFVMIASPFAPNGGIYSRFPGLFIPFIIDPIGPSQPTRYDTTYHAIEYDPVADFPAYFNPLSLLNAALAARYAHPDRYYDAIDPETTPHLEKEVVNSAGGTDTYILYRNQQLPLLGPIRELSSMLQLTLLTEPFLGAIEPLLRVVVDMGYTDRTYANADVNTPFSLFTPPDRIIKALLAVPGALHEGLMNFQEGMTNLLSGGQTALAAKSLATDSKSIAVAASPSASPSVVPGLHGSDFTALQVTESTETDVAQPEPVVAQEETTEEATVDPETPETEPTKPLSVDSLKPKLTSNGNKVTPIGATKAPATSTGASPVSTTPAETTPGAATGSITEPDPKTEPKSEPETKVSEPDAKPDTKPDTKTSAPDSDNDRKDAAA